MANVPSESQITSTHLGLQQQAVEYGEKLVATKSTAQEKLDAAYSAAGDKVAAARTAYFNAQENPNISQDKLAQLKASYNSAKDERATIGEQAEANQASLEKAQSGLDSNKVAFANAQNTASNTGTSVTSSTPVFNDVAATNAEAVGSNNTIPQGATVNAAEPTASNSQIPTQEQYAELRAIQTRNNGGVDIAAVDPALQAQLDAIEASRTTPGPVRESPIPTQAEYAELKAIQDAYTVKDPAAVAQAAENEAALARIDANRKVQADVPATVDTEGIAAAAAAQKENEAAQKPVSDDPMQAALDAQSTEDSPGPTEQLVLDASQDAKLSQEEQGQLREFQESQRAKLKAESDAAGNPEGNWKATSVNAVREKAVQAVQRNARQQEDWRVRLQLAPSANYLYNDPTIKQGDLLYPLKATNGVIFPYTPVINSSYRANYDPSDVAHSNYKMYFYKNSSVDELSIQADFTAQDTTEALYMLAVIHFFRSVTKMFYGKDAGPTAGTPPPLCYLFGYGQYQYSDHPLLVTSFAYNLPNDVDYIRAGSTTQWAGQNVGSYGTKPTAPASIFSRLFSAGLNKGGISKEPTFSQLSNSQATYVPTKLSITLSLLPVVTRYDIANNFSVTDYAKGKLYKGGIW